MLIRKTIYCDRSIYIVFQVYIPSALYIPQLKTCTGMQCARLDTALWDNNLNQHQIPDLESQLKKTTNYPNRIA